MDESAVQCVGERKSFAGDVASVRSPVACTVTKRLVLVPSYTHTAGADWNADTARSAWRSAWGSIGGSVWGSVASESVAKSRSATSTRARTRSVEAPTRVQKRTLHHRMPRSRMSED
jgi:hypothetical protein